MIKTVWIFQLEYPAKFEQEIKSFNDGGTTFIEEAIANKLETRVPIFAQPLDDERVWTTQNFQIHRHARLSTVIKKQSVSHTLVAHRHLAVTRSIKIRKQSAHASIR